MEDEEAEPLEYWQQEVEDEEAEPLEYWQQQVKEEEVESIEDKHHQGKEEEMEPLKKKQTEKEAERQVEGGSADNQVHGRREHLRLELNQTQQREGGRMVHMGLPFLTGISPAGFLSANRKQAGGSDHVIKVT